VIVDGGPKIVSWVVDGVLNDGGAVRCAIFVCTIAI